MIIMWDAFEWDDTHKTIDLMGHRGGAPNDQQYWEWWIGLSVEDQSGPGGEQSSEIVWNGKERKTTKLNILKDERDGWDGWEKSQVVGESANGLGGERCDGGREDIRTQDTYWEYWGYRLGVLIFSVSSLPLFSILLFHPHPKQTFFCTLCTLGRYEFNCISIEFIPTT